MLVVGLFRASVEDVEKKKQENRAFDDERWSVMSELLILLD